MVKGEINIPNIKLKSGISIPALGLGTWQLTGEKCKLSVKKALDLGYRHIDTAELYDNQELIGQAIKESGAARKELFLTSKVWRNNLRYEATLKACDKTLKELGTDYLDLYLLHWPNNSVPFKETFRAFKRLLQEKKVRGVGISNFTIKKTAEALEAAKKIGITIDTNQVEFHPLLYQRELLDFSEKHGIKITAYSPIARGKVCDDKIICELANKYKKTSGQISLRWLLQKGTIVIPKAASEEHLKENMKIFDWKLAKEDEEKIDAIKKHMRLVNPFLMNMAGFDGFDD